MSKKKSTGKARAYGIICLYFSGVFIVIIMTGLRWLAISDTVLLTLITSWMTCFLRMLK